MLKNNSHTVTTGIKDKRIIISFLWIVVMLNMIFADIWSLFLPGALEELITGTVDGVKMSGNLMFISAIILEIPIMMVFLSRVLKHKINRLLNIIAAVLTIGFVIGGGSLNLNYIFFASIEIICMISIMYLAITWQEE